MRYRKEKILKDKNGIRYYKPTIVQNIPLQDTDRFIFPFDGDRLDIIAQRYYGDSNLWWVIAKSNVDLFDGGIFLKPGEEYRIPTDLTESGQEFITGGGVVGSVSSGGSSAGGSGGSSGGGGGGY